MGKGQVSLRFFQRRTRVKPSLLFVCLGEHIHEVDPAEPDGNITPLGNRRGMLRKDVPVQYPERGVEGEGSC